MAIFILLGMTAAWYSCSLLVHTSIISTLLLKNNSKKRTLIFYGLGSFFCLFTVGVTLSITSKSIGIIRESIIPILETVNGPILIVIGAYFVGWIKKWRIRKVDLLNDQQIKNNSVFFLGISLSLTLCPTFLLIYMTQVIPRAIAQNTVLIGLLLFSLSYVISIVLGGYFFHVLGERIVFSKVTIDKTSKWVGYILMLIGLYLSIQLNIKLLNQW